MKKKKKQSPSTDKATLIAIAVIAQLNIRVIQTAPMFTLGELIPYYLINVGIVYLVKYKKKG